MLPEDLGGRSCGSVLGILANVFGKELQLLPASLVSVLFILFLDTKDQRQGLPHARQVLALGSLNENL